MNAVKKKKGLSAFIAVLTAAALMLSLAVSAFGSGVAATGTTEVSGNIAVGSIFGKLQGTMGSITVTKYVDNGNTQTTTGLQRTDLQGYTPLEGATYTVTQTHSYDKATGQFYKVTSHPKTATVKTNKSGVAQFTDLPFGRYEVQETAVPADAVDPVTGTTKTYELDSTKYYVTIPLFNDEGQAVLDHNNPITNVFLYPKNFEKIVKKTESKTDSDYKVYQSGSALPMEIGKPYYYRVDLVVPNDYKDSEGRITYTQFKVEDQLDSKISYVDGAALYLVKKGQVAEKQLTDAVKISTPEANKTGKITATITPAESHKIEAGDTIRLKFRALLNKENIANAFKEVPNGADVTFVNNKTKTSHTPKTYTKPEPGKLKLVKVSSDNEGTKLANAQFSLYREISEEQAIKEGYGSKDVVTIDKTGGKKGVLIGSQKTNESGEITWENLVPGGYYIVETQAPAGYNLLPAALYTKVVKGETSVAGNNITVKNVPTGKLPKTGGIGTPLFIVGGTLMMGCAAYFLFRNRREQH